MTSRKEESIVLRRSLRSRSNRIVPKLQQIKSTWKKCATSKKKYRRGKHSAATANYVTESRITKSQNDGIITQSITDDHVIEQVPYSQFPELLNIDIEELGFIMPYEMASFIENSNFDSTNFISTELESTNSSIHDATSKSNTSFPNSSMSYASNTSDEVFTVNDIGVLDMSSNKKRLLVPESVLTPQLEDLSVNKMKPTDSAFGRNTHSIDVMENKENYQVQLAASASSQAQEPTELSSIKKSVPMSTNLTMESAAVDIYRGNAQPTTHLKIHEDTVSILQNMLKPQGIQPTYEFLPMNDGLCKCLVSADHHNAIGTGNSQNEAKHSAATSLIDQLSSGQLFGNPIGKLQELCAHFHWPAPKYQEIFRLPKESHFTIVCKLNISQRNFITTEQGKSKKSAKRLAALKMLMKTEEIFSK